MYNAVHRKLDLHVSLPLFSRRAFIGSILSHVVGIARSLFAKHYDGTIIIIYGNETRRRLSSDIPGPKSCFQHPL